MSSPTERLARNRDLTAEKANRTEFEGLVRSGLARLEDARNEKLSIDGRFDLAYGAAHALSLAALRYRGFRSGKRYVVFQVLEDTLGLKPAVWRVLSKAHDARNLSEYEGVIDVDERMLTDLIQAVHAVAKALGDLPALK